VTENTKGARCERTPSSISKGPLQEENIVSEAGAADVPNVESYPSDIASTAKEAAETENPRVRRACIKVLANQTRRLTALVAMLSGGSAA
jgi:hypothetical protein